MKLNLSSRALALAFLTILATPVLAQQPAQPNYLPPTPAISDTQFATAKEIVGLTGISKTFDPFIPAMLNELQGNLTRTRPELLADMNAVMKEKIAPEFTKRNEEMIDYAARLVATAMPESELKETLAFLKTSAGKHYTDLQPLILSRIVAGLDAWNRVLSVEMMDRVRAEMKKKGHDL
ncbi:MAG: uncharacterized protein JWL62_309 [Hyphomicrobiales bacterium]|nr:uncharacterized protein [Hyphomicrobiales bacterium]